MGALKDELTGLIGQQGLEALAKARGGRRAYIPREIRAGHWIERAVGRRLADALAGRYGGCRIDVPRRAPPAGRDTRIHHLRRQGWSVSSIAAVTGLSERWVRKLLNR